MKSVLFVFGTRPEAIKLAPLILKMQKDSFFKIKVCITAQHREMLDQILYFFNIKPDYDLDLMQPNQTLFDITAKALKGLESVLKDCAPDLIFVQGDTTSVLAGALAGFYSKIKVAHLEAGLRSGDKLSPFPEEINRILAGHIADYHFAPTKASCENLYKENITNNVYMVGNTVIDALLIAKQLISERKLDNDFISFFEQSIPNFGSVFENKRIVLLTGHRRENFGKPFENVCSAINAIAKKYPDVEIIYPVHLNPNVREPVYRLLKNFSNIHLLEPLDYPKMIWLLSKSYIVLTDSGGIQEEAPSLNKPVLVLRDVTERMEGVLAGTAKLVGTDYDRIVSNVSQLLDEEDAYNAMVKSINPYGQGETSDQVIAILKTSL